MLLITNRDCFQRASFSLIPGGPFGSGDLILPHTYPIQNHPPPHGAWLPPYTNAETQLNSHCSYLQTVIWEANTPKYREKNPVWPDLSFFSLTHPNPHISYHWLPKPAAKPGSFPPHIFWWWGQQPAFWSQREVSGILYSFTPKPPNFLPWNARGVNPSDLSGVYARIHYLSRMTPSSTQLPQSQ